MKRSLASLPTPAVQQHSILSLKGGQRPEKRRKDAAGVPYMFGWQIAGYEALKGARFRILRAPTGAGKSTLIKALACTELAADRKRKVIVVVPQTIIGASFGDSDIRLDESTVFNWRAETRLLNVARSVAQFVGFIQNPAAATLGGRALVCTHQTLVAAHAKILAVHQGKGSPWKGVSLYIDEAHHSNADDSDEEDVAINRLGAVVSHYLESKPGPLLLATATFMRADLNGIIPEKRRADFTRFEHTMEDHLAGLQPGFTVSMRFLVGKPEECLKAIYAEGNAKTIAYLPNVGSQAMQALGGKHEAMSHFQRAVGKVIRKDAWTSTLRCSPKGKESFDVRVLDFVTVEGRDERKEALWAGIKAGGKTATPDILWALNLGKEGFDWPELERSIVIGGRGSIVDILQIMGRALRFHPGKKRAEFNMVLPWEGKVDVRQTRDCMKIIIASMVVEWPLKLPTFDSGTTPKEHAAAKRVTEKLASDPQHTFELLSDVTNDVIAHGDQEPDVDKIIGAAIDKAGVADGPEERKAAVKAVRSMFSQRTEAMLRNADDLPFDIKVNEGVFGCVKLLGASFGYKTLGEIREAIGTRTSVTATQEEVSSFCKGMTAKEYDLCRPHGYPCSANVYDQYGVTYGSLSGTTPNTADSEAVKSFCAGKPRRIYDSTKPSNYPYSSSFKRIFGLSYGQMSGTGHEKIVVRKDDVFALAKGKSKEEYAAIKPKGFPDPNRFKQVYGVSYGLISGTSKAITADISAVKNFCKGMPQRQYDTIRPKGYPRSGHFERCYGISYAQASGTSRAVTAKFVDVVKFCHGVGQDEYDRTRPKGFPSAQGFVRLYGRSYGDVANRPQGTNGYASAKSSTKRKP